MTNYDLRETVATTNYTDPREAVAASCRVLGVNGQSDWAQGHVAVRDPDGRGAWLKPAGFRLEEIKPEDVHLVDWDGDVIEGTTRRHGEWPIHTELMRARPDVNATVHTHPPYCVALSASGKPLLPVGHPSTPFLPGDVPRFSDFIDLICTKEQAQGMIRDLGDRPAVFLVNHGIVTVGDTIERATMHALLLEQACEQQFFADGFGGVGDLPPDDEVRAMGEQIGDGRVHVIQFAAELWRADRLMPI